MAIESQRVVHEHFIELFCEGDFELDDFLRAVERGIDYAIAKGQRAALIDVSAVRGAPSTLERFELGKRVAELQLGKESLVALAVLGRQPLIDPNRFGETVALNRCAVGKAFENREDALGWLEQTSG